MRRSRKLAAPLLGMAGAAVVGSLLAGAPAAMATAGLEPREGRKEWRRVPNCVTVKTPAQDLRAGKLVTREFSCPKGTYFWNWSATVAQFVQVSLQETRLDRKKHEVAATFEYYAQTGNGTGAAQVYLGCSPAPIASGKLTQRRLSYGWNPHQ
ncbi:MAG: hypothetical protein WAS21_25875 [Geminicoccaceae bacterium]